MTIKITKNEQKFRQIEQKSENFQKIEWNYRQLYELKKNCFKYLEKYGKRTKIGTIREKKDKISKTKRNFYMWINHSTRTLNKIIKVLTLSPCIGIRHHRKRKLNVMLCYTINRSKINMQNYCLVSKSPARAQKKVFWILNSIISTFGSNNVYCK